jgi:hypothetical protein
VEDQKEFMFEIPLVGISLNSFPEPDIPIRPHPDSSRDGEFFGSFFAHSKNEHLSPATYCKIKYQIDFSE